MTDSRPAILFDVDGTLVDTNYLHTVAWWRAFQDIGEEVPMSRIHPLIGMGSDQLVERLIGREPPEHAPRRLSRSGPAVGPPPPGRFSRKRPGGDPGRR